MTDEAGITMQAPNYFKVVDKPMDFTTMHAKLAKNEYTTWDALQTDLELMFTNCMKYNSPDTKYHKQVCPPDECTMSWPVTSPKS